MSIVSPPTRLKTCAKNRIFPNPIDDKRNPRSFSDGSFDVKVTFRFEGSEPLTTFFRFWSTDSVLDENKNKYFGTGFFGFWVPVSNLYSGYALRFR